MKELIKTIQYRMKLCKMKRTLKLMKGGLEQCR